MTEQGGSWRKAAFAAAALMVASLLSTCPGVLRGETLFLRDLSAFHRPLRRLLLELAASSDGLPGWNPYSHFGQPFAANPNAAVFDPWSALFWVLPFDLAFNLQVLLPLLVGAGGFALLVRARGGSRFSAAFGALSWGIGGCALSVSGFLQMHHSVALLPLALALAYPLMLRPSARAVAALGCVLGVQGLSGSPTGLMITALLLPFAAWDARTRDVDRGRPGLVSAWRALVAAVLLGAAVGAATWLPALQLLRESGRVADEGFREEAAGWSLPPVRLVELVAPHAFGRVEQETVGMYWGRELYGWRQWPYLFSIYGGLAGFVLAVTAARARRRAERPWLLVGALGLLLSFGAHLPGWALLSRAVPLLGVVRFPEKWAVVPALVLALLAARGLDLVLRDDGSERFARGMSAWLAAGLAMLFAVLAISRASVWLEAWAVPDWLAPRVTVAVLSDFAVQVLIATAVAAAFWVRRRRGFVLPALLLVFTATDLVLAGRQLMPTVEPALLDRRPSVLAPLLALPAGERTLFHYADWKGHQVRQGGRQLLLEAPVPWQWGITTAFEKDFDGTHLAWSRAATQELMPLMAAEPNLVGPILERRGVRFVLRPPAGGERVAVTLLATRAARPFAYSAEAVVVRERGETLAGAVRRAGAAVILEPGAEAPARPAPVALEILERGPERLRMRSRASGPGVIALNITWHPDWRTSVDGRAVGVLQADGHLSAIVVPAGDHEVLLRFRSAPLVLGLLVSAFGVLLAVALALSGRRPGRRAVLMASSEHS